MKEKPVSRVVQQTWKGLFLLESHKKHNQVAWYFTKIRETKCQMNYDARPKIKVLQEVYKIFTENSKHDRPLGFQFNRDRIRLCRMVARTGDSGNNGSLWALNSNRKLRIIMSKSEQYEKRKQTGQTNPRLQTWRRRMPRCRHTTSKRAQWPKQPQKKRPKTV